VCVLGERKDPTQPNHTQNTRNNRKKKTTLCSFLIPFCPTPPPSPPHSTPPPPRSTQVPSPPPAPVFFTQPHTHTPIELFSDNSARTPPTGFWGQSHLLPFITSIGGLFPLVASNFTDCNRWSNDFPPYCLTSILHQVLMDCLCTLLVVVVVVF